MQPTREIVVATPDTGEDLYAVHQQVWEGVSPWIGSGRRESDGGHGGGHTFIYAPESPDPSRRHEGLWRVRSARLPAQGTRAARLPPSGTMCITLAASRTEQHRQLDIAADEQLDWACGVLARNGFTLRKPAITARWIAFGHKRSSGQRIRLPACHLEADFDVVDPHLAGDAFAGGIGRAKRFGFGMLRIVA